ncbi:MAG TPA: UrcA family protein [Rhizomicrobium sp.]|nr:UrcA family protein [Rhizomicrobium sp.]
MTRTAFRYFALAALMLTAMGGNNHPAWAQAGAKWKPGAESIIVSAKPSGNWRIALSGSHLGSAILVSASIPVPYSDLNLTKEPDAAELGRRIHVAARLVCQELDIKYPPNLFPIVEGYSGYECERAAAGDGMSRADMIIADARR